MVATRKEWLWLTTRTGLSPAGLQRVLEHFQTPQQVYYGDNGVYRAIPGLSQRAVRSLTDKDMSGVEEILGTCDRLGISILTFQDTGYPQRLREIHDPPLVLYYKGRLPDFDGEAAVAVVGARRPSSYGEKMAGKLGLELARGGALVVSGIAQGLDAAALRGALKGGGRVVSVLGNGIDVVYPRENRALYEDVAAAGCLISEYPPGTEPRGEHFPVRNRIISGLALGVVVVECALHSGTMTTARCALEQNRDVFAVPGNADAPLSAGSNRLIRQGAVLVTCGEDILEEYRGRYPLSLRPPLAPEVEWARLTEAPEPSPPSTRQAAEPARMRVYGEEQRRRFTDDQLVILAALGESSRNVDELVERTQLPTRRVLSALTMLQLDAVVEERPGRRFRALVELEPIR